MVRGMVWGLVWGLVHGMVHRKVWEMIHLLLYFKRFTYILRSLNIGYPLLTMIIPSNPIVSG